MPKIVHAFPNEDHTILIELDNNHKIIYDMRSRLQTVRFCGLADLDSFKMFKIENGNTLVWDSLCQISIDEIINIIER